MAMWEEATNLKFIEKDSGKVHIEISFVEGEHGDGDPFDGPGGTLGHAYFPQFGGDVHLDDTEYWTINSFKGTNLLQTLTHELGHSLGLSHSEVEDAMMAPFYRGWDPDMKLHPDDIAAIRVLYGEKVVETTTDPSSTFFTGSFPTGSDTTGTGTDMPVTSRNYDNTSICSDPYIDSIVRIQDGTSFIFRGGLYWKLTSSSIASGYPRRIVDDWEGLQDDLDAAFTWRASESTYFFNGDKYWKFKNLVPFPNYPRLIKNGFPGVPNNVDAAFVWGGNNKIYFFKGSKYWKFDPERKPHVRTDRYPKNISGWDVPNNIEGALQYANGKTYFFKQGLYWRFNDQQFTVDTASPQFPRDTAEWWFGCPSSSQLLQGDTGVRLLGNQPQSYGHVGVVDLGVGQEDLDVGDEDLDVGDEDLDVDIDFK